MTDRISLPAKLAELFILIDQLKATEKENSRKIIQLEQDTSLSAKLDELFSVIDHLKEAEDLNSKKIERIEHNSSVSAKLDELFKVVDHFKEANGTNSQTINQNSSLSLKLDELLKVIDHLKEAEKLILKRINQLEEDASISARINDQNLKTMYLNYNCKLEQAKEHMINELKSFADRMAESVDNQIVNFQNSLERIGNQMSISEN